MSFIIEILTQITKRADVIIISIVILFMWITNKSGHNHITSIIEKMETNIEKLSNKLDDLKSDVIATNSKLDKYVFKFEDEESKEWMKFFKHIVTYVDNDFNNILTYLKSKLVDNDSLRDKYINRDDPQEEITKILENHLMTKVIGSTEAILKKEGYSQIVINALNDCNKTIYPFFRKELKDIVDHYITGNGSRASTIPILLKAIVAETREKYVKQLELLLSNKQ